jgi:hypothetical protein
MFGSPAKASTLPYVHIHQIQSPCPDSKDWESETPGSCTMVTRLHEQNWISEV